MYALGIVKKCGSFRNRPKVCREWNVRRQNSETFAPLKGVAARD